MRVSLDKIAELIKAKGHPAFVDQTGGGVACVFAGKVRVDDPEYGERYEVVIGNGWFDKDDNAWATTGDGEFSFGRDEEDQDFTYYFNLVSNEETVADVIVGYLNTVERIKTQWGNGFYENIWKCSCGTWNRSGYGCCNSLCNKLEPH